MRGAGGKGFRYHGLGLTVGDTYTGTMVLDDARQARGGLPRRNPALGTHARLDLSTIRAGREVGRPTRIVDR